MGSGRERIAVPAPVQKPAPHPFPLMAAIAPVAMSVVIFFVSHSPFALVFAALGPVVAIASVVDSRVQARRRTRAERARFARDLGRTRDEVAAAHARERRELDLDAPSAAALLARGDHDPERFAATIEGVLLVLGRGAVPSEVDLDAPPGHDEESARLRELATAAATLGDAPITVPARLGIAIVGADPIAGSVARGLVIQLAARLSPLTHELVAGEELATGHWLRALPHRLVLDPALPRGAVALRSRDGAGLALVATARQLDDVTSGCRVVVRASARGEIVAHPDRARLGPVELELASREQCGLWAARLAQLARGRGEKHVSAVPDTASLGDLLAAAVAPDRSGLAGIIGLGSEGVHEIDLVRDGPHAIVGGTTGSGKSELLVSWVLSLAWRYPPDHVTFLLVDFKGGASFAPLESLEHCVGVMSDLDERAAIRALESLKAEVRFREQTIAEARVRSVDRLPPEAAIPRLVIVVDEFAAMVAEFPDLHALFGDLAARGRSLGMHLVLCTQRPAGVVRDAVLANAGLRISLRVNNRADSTAVIGTDAAAALPANPAGRALVAISGQEPVEVQVPLATEEDATRVAERHPRGTAPPRRPWRDPLPSTIPVGELPAGAGIVFGLADHPHEQAQPPATWNPRTDGHVLAIGAARSGKSTFLRAVAASLPVTVELVTAVGGAEAMWDAVTALLDRTRRDGAAGAETVLLLDDLDAVLARLSDEHATAFADALVRLLRDGPARGMHAVIATQRLTPPLHAIASLCDCRLVLRMPNRQEHVLAGGVAADFDERAVPGRGSWRGHPVHVAQALGELEHGVARVTELELGPGSTLAIVTPNAAARAAELRQRVVAVTVLGAGPGSAEELSIAPGSAPSVLIGDPDAWQSRWGSLQAVAATTRVLFEGCSLAEYRTLTRSRELPPPLLPGTGILLAPGLAPQRARLRSPAR